MLRGQIDLFDQKPWPFAPLSFGAYSLLMIDPPWAFVTRSEKGQGKSPSAHYGTMTMEEIAALPVADLAADDCLLWMWCTGNNLPQALQIMDAWGFVFSTSGAWVKTTRRGKIAFGTGFVLRNSHEPFLIGRRGAPKIAVRNVRSTLMAPVREHSRKPDLAYQEARRLIPYGRAADIFSRETRDGGWESWGNEAGKFDGDPTLPLAGQHAAGDGDVAGQPTGRRGVELAEPVQAEAGCDAADGGLATAE